MPSHDTHLELDNDGTELERLASQLELFGSEGDLSAEMLSEINLVIEELVTNVFNHGAEQGRDPGALKVSIDLSLSDGELAVRIEDNGRAYDPLQAAPPDLQASLDERAVGGLGVHLVRTLMDQVEYRNEAGRNVLEMRKRIVG